MGIDLLYILVQNPSRSSSVFARKVDNLDKIVSLELVTLINDYLLYCCKKCDYFT